MNYKLYEASNFGEKTFKKHDSDEKSIFPSQAFEEKFIPEKQFLKNISHTKKHVLVHFFRENTQILCFMCSFKKYDCKVKSFSKKHDFENKIFSKKHRFE